MRRRAARAAVFVVLPATLTALVFRALVPTTQAAAGTPYEGLARAAAAYPVALAAALFLGFAAATRTWATGLEVTRGAGTWRGAVGLVAATALAACSTWAARARIAEPYLVTSASMLPTLEPGDQVGADKMAFTKAPPRRGEAIVFANTEAGPDHLVKRVVGLPGDRVGMRGGHPVINGWEVPSCDAGTYAYAVPDGAVHGRLVVEFLDGAAYLTVHTPHARAFAEYEVKPGELFVLGDNRNASTDSRAWNGGRGAGVPMPAVAGRAEWFLIGHHRDGTVDATRALARLGMTVHLEGVDTRGLEEGIARCLARRPERTAPPT